MALYSVTRNGQDIVVKFDQRVSDEQVAAIRNKMGSIGRLRSVRTTRRDGITTIVATIMVGGLKSHQLGDAYKQTMAMVRSTASYEFDMNKAKA